LRCLAWPAMALSPGSAKLPKMFFLKGVSVRASIYKIITDHEGESKITFLVPRSELAAAIKLNLLLEKELIIEVKESKSHSYEINNA